LSIREHTFQKLGLQKSFDGLIVPREGYYELVLMRNGSGFCHPTNPAQQSYKMEVDAFYTAHSGEWERDGGDLYDSSKDVSEASTGQTEV